MDEQLLKALARFWCEPELDIADVILEIDGGEDRLAEIYEQRD